MFDATVEFVTETDKICDKDRGAFESGSRSAGGCGASGGPREQPLRQVPHKTHVSKLNPKP